MSLKRRQFIFSYFVYIWSISGKDYAVLAMMSKQNSVIYYYYCYYYRQKIYIYY